MEYIKSLPDNAFDLAIVDPPYGIGLPIASTGKWKREIHEKKDWDNETPSQEYFDHLIRISKNQIIWGANYFMSKISFDSPCWIFWDKKNGNNFMSDGELAYTSFKTAVRRFEYNHIQEHNLGIKRIHPTQKPVKLYEWLLTNYAKQGDKILDTHLGSGSHAIACNNLGFELVGLELDSDYFKASCERIAKEAQQERLF
jgi:site-specific DNA-methyltransferase (adenine-specific)